MSDIFNLIKFISKILHIIAGAAITFMMLLTFLDVLLRASGVPIVGTFEIVSLSLALVIGFGIPQVSLEKGHVTMDFLVEKLPPKGKKLMTIFTRFICIILFALIGYNLFNVGEGFRLSGEVSPTIKLPFYPLAYGVGVCCLLECFVFLFEIFNIWSNKNE